MSNANTPKYPDCRHHRNLATQNATTTAFRPSLGGAGEQATALSSRWEARHPTTQMSHKAYRSIALSAKLKYPWFTTIR
jgi:hypothetical protein